MEKSKSNGDKKVKAKKLQPGSVRVYKNKFKIKGETKSNAPDMIGRLVDHSGTEYYVSLWICTSTYSGEKYMKGFIENKNEIDESRKKGKLKKILKF